MVLWLLLYDDGVKSPTNLDILLHHIYPYYIVYTLALGSRYRLLVTQVLIVRYTMFVVMRETCTVTSSCYWVYETSGEFVTLNCQKVLEMHLAKGNLYIHGDGANSRFCQHCKWIISIFNLITMWLCGRLRIQWKLEGNVRFLVDSKPLQQLQRLKTVNNTTYFTAS